MEIWVFVWEKWVGEIVEMVGRGEKSFWVDGRCKQWISGDVVGALTGKKKNLRVGLVSKERGGSEKLGRGEKAMDGGRKKERENRRYENGLRRERESPGGHLGI